MSTLLLLLYTLGYRMAVNSRYCNAEACGSAVPLPPFLPPLPPLLPILPIEVLAVEDIAAQPRTGTASVLVYVDNENDNSPVFLPSDSYTVSVLEEQPPVSVLQVCVCVCVSVHMRHMRYKVCVCMYAQLRVC